MARAAGRWDGSAGDRPYSSGRGAGARPERVAEYDGRGAEPGHGGTALRSYSTLRDFRVPLWPQ